MLTDRYAGSHTTGSREAVEFFSDAVLAVAQHRPGAADLLAGALASDPDFVAAHALRGFAALILGRQECHAPARAACDAAEAALALHGGTGHETALVVGLRRAVNGSGLQAAAILDTRLAEAPHEFLCMKLAHALRFMGGDLAGMLAATGRAVAFWDDARPGAGFVHGCHAFGMEEAGFFSAAERFGRKAVELEPTDAWGLHAVSHVHEMQRRTAEGIQWLEGSRPAWRACANFSFHIAWHLALFKLEAGDVGGVLSLYDEEVRPTPTDDFRDVANAASLLWRLRQEGVDCGSRWDELARIARHRAGDTTLMFASLHHLLSLKAAGDEAAAQDLAAAIEARAADPTTDQGAVARDVGAPLARAVLASSSGPGLVRLARDLPRLGGSHAQRDVFARSLAMLAADRGDRETLERILALRHRLHAADRFSTLALDRLAAAGAAPPARHVA